MQREDQGRFLWPLPAQKTDQEHLHRPTYNQEAPPKLRLQQHAVQRTPAIAWFFAICCALLWIVVILGGLAVLIVYLVFRPRSPRLEMSGVTLNAAYLDQGSLLNADVTMLANFSNPNHKVDVAFSYLQLNLYFKDIMIATQAIDGFAQRRDEDALRSVHMVSSQVALSEDRAKAWNAAEGAGSIPLQLQGRFRTRSYLSGWLHSTYWLRAICNIDVSLPPNGILLSSNCTTKRSG